MSPAEGLHVVVVGAGAIGSFAIYLVARVPGVARITLVDPDRYTESNLRGQNIFRCDLGEFKVAVHACRLRAAFPRIAVTAIPMPVGEVPIGLLRADLILACVDSRLARQTINFVASRLGVPWIDSGVLESEKLARVNIYAPGVSSPCLECAWGENDYALIEAEYPCGAPGAAVASSDTSAELASLAASLLAIECSKMLSGDEQHAAIGRQVTVDARTHRMISTVFRRNPDCRFCHGSWESVPLRRSLRRFSVSDALAVMGRVSVPGHRFVRSTVCPQCSIRVEGLRLDRPQARCRECGARMIAPSFDAMLAQLDSSLPQEDQGRSLAQIGLCHGDVVCGTEKQFELLGEGL
jgi:molybdopterin/thiamine biosynthesis adenylyltransferase